MKLTQFYFISLCLAASMQKQSTHKQLLLSKLLVKNNILDNQLPVILLAIRLRSLDLKHLIPGNGPPELQG